MISTRILIVEDDLRLSSVMKLAFTGDPRFSLVGVHSSAEDALQHADWAEVDVLISDLGLPGMDGVGLITLTLQTAPHVLCLAYTLNSEKESVFAALRAGAKGYLLKGCTLLDLQDSVLKVLAGECPISPAIAGRLLEFFLTQQHPSAAETLSAREVEIIRLIAAGHSYKEVAALLGVSPHTVHTHIKNTYTKLKSCGKKEALQRAKELGYLS